MALTVDVCVRIDRARIKRVAHRGQNQGEVSKLLERPGIRCMGNLRGRQPVACHPIRQALLSIPDACAAGRASLAARGTATERVRHRGGNLERSCQNRTPPVSCPPSSLLRPSGCDRFWHLGSAPLGSFGSSPRFGILFWRFPRSTD